ncbi:MAG TPA: zinc ribbon domain-containing protein [Pyrinomonadaceae bacterium]|nr:zinc ribbon domain-containing protein [Pyrinomonadaceae bacterium]
MFCPACGSNNATDQRFCRKCGMNLESTSDALREWRPSESVSLLTQERRLERFGQFAFGGFGIVLVLAVAGLIYTIFTKMVLVGGQPVAGLLLIAFLVFAVLTLGYVVFNEDLKEKRKKAGRTLPNELENPAVTGRLLEDKEFEPMPTVTENTTNLLPLPKPER